MSQLTDDDMDVIRSSLTLLSEMQDAAETIEDMQGEISVEITQSCIMTRKKMAKIVEAKSMLADDIESITVYLEMIDFIDSCLNCYKARYQELKAQKLKFIED